MRGDPMWKNLADWSQKKLKTVNVCMNVLYFALTFLAPIIVVVVEFCKLSASASTKVSMIFIIFAVCIVLICARLLKKQVEKIKILNIDGTYNNKARTFKHIMLSIYKLVLPVAILIVSVVFSTFLKEQIDFYVTLIIIIVSFYIAGGLVDSLILAFLDEELEIRDRVAEQNAISLRSGIK